jgi:hypothetical protein
MFLATANLCANFLLIKIIEVSKMRNLVFLSIFCLFTAGCGEFAYKRGASAKDFDASRKSCQSSGNEAAIEKCLEDNGWIVQKLDALGLPDSELFATASVSEDNRNPTPASTTEASTSEASISQTVAETTPETINLSQSKHEKAAPKAETSQTEVVSKPSDVAKDSTASPQTKAETLKRQIVNSANPYEKYKINSWWKMGGGRDALELSMETCTKRLGDTHLPDRKNQIFTRAFAACMYENGWRGLREK